MGINRFVPIVQFNNLTVFKNGGGCIVLVLYYLVFHAVPLKKPGWLEAVRLLQAVRFTEASGRADEASGV